MQLRRARLHAGARIGYRARGFVCDLDQFESIFGNVTILGDDDRHRIADITHFGRRNRRLLRAFQAGNDAGAHGNSFQPRHVGSREHADDAR